MVDVIAAFLGLTLVLYLVLGGADFGAGIWEITKGRHGRAHEELVSHAMGPVWEANHVWLVIALVILFTAFPPAFRQLAVTFHVPLTLLLLGIVCRGCAFTFRHYDAVQTPRTRRLYTFVFEAASLLTPVMLGLIAGAIILDRAPAETGDFAATYLWPWLTPFGACLALFLLVLFAYLAAVFLAGETDDPALRQLFVARARATAIVAVATGLAVFVAGQRSGLPLAQLFLATPASLACMVLATLLLEPLHRALARGRVLAPRLLVSAQVALVVGGWGALRYPVIFSVAGKPLTVSQAAAPEATLAQLLLALVVGSALIFPALGYLLVVFKIRSQVLPADRR